MIKQVYTYYDPNNPKEAFDFEYCPYCRTKLTLVESGGLRRPTCPACGFIHFRNPSPTVCVAIIDQDGRGGLVPHSRIAARFSLSGRY